MDTQEQLCQFEQQKSKITQLYLGVYENSIFQNLGPKLQSSETLKCQPKILNTPQQLNIQEDSYLNIQELCNYQYCSNIPKTSHTQHQSQNSQLLGTEPQNNLITEEAYNKNRRKFGFKRFGSSIKHSDSSIIVDPSINPKDLKECLICFGDKSKQSFLAPLACNHEFCKDCLKDHLTQNIKRGNVLQILCPQADCQSKFYEEQIKQLVSLKNYEKYKKFYQRQQISQNKNVRWCPKPDCENYAIGNGNELLVCQCGQQICFNCGNRFHPGLNCVEAEDAQYIQARIKNQIHDCPNCKSPIEKKGGCNHMTCYKCKYQFCWICKGKYSSYHYVIFNVFGCVVPGGQSANLQPFKNPMFLRIMMILPKILLTILFISGLLVVFPFFLLYFIISAPYQIIKRSCGFRFGRHHKCVQLGYGIIFFFVGILLSPLTIIISPCWLLYVLIDNL